MKKRIGLARGAVAALGLALVTMSGGTAIAADKEVPFLAIIPKPLLIEYTGEAFTLDEDTEIRYTPGSEEANKIAQQLIGVLNPSTGFELVASVESSGSDGKNSIQLLLSGDEALGDEGYTIRVGNDSLIASAAAPAGLFYATQTIRQMFPPEIESDSIVTGLDLTIPGAVIIDKPRFAWRGNLLDCSRHFMTKERILRYLDDLAYHKMNKFHWHLVDDPGWRLEIKKYPRLTEFGAWRGKGEDRYGGFYTQEEIKEIVAYAADRYIEVIPEIEMPGHSTAAIASYPYISCFGEPTEVRTEWGAPIELLCAGNEETFTFLQDVMEEVVTLFPSQYIHIGGDEAPKVVWKKCPKCQQRMKDEGIETENALQSYMINRVQAMLAKHDKKIMGWDEIYEGGLAEGTILQYWRHKKNFLGAIAQGNPVVASPHTDCYFDYPEVLDSNNGKPDWMPALPLEKAYAFEPLIEGIEPHQEHLILGSECAMWTEWATSETLDYQLYPRVAAFTEVVWSQRNARDYADFQKRLAVHYDRMDQLGIEYNPMEKEALANAE